MKPWSGGPLEGGGGKNRPTLVAVEEYSVDHGLVELCRELFTARIGRCGCVGRRSTRLKVARGRWAFPRTSSGAAASMLERDVRNHVAIDG